MSLRKIIDEICEREALVAMKLPMKQHFLLNLKLFILFCQEIKEPLPKSKDYHNIDILYCGHKIEYKNNFAHCIIETKPYKEHTDKRIDEFIMSLVKAY